MVFEFDSLTNHIKEVTTLLTLKLKVMDIEKLKKWAESDAGEQYFKELAKKEELRQARHRRFEEWLKDTMTNTLISATTTVACHTQTGN